MWLVKPGFCKVLVSSKLFIAYQSYVKSRSLPPSPNLNTTFFPLSSHLQFILYMKVPKFLCSMIVLTQGTIN
jgi:hypothetical protein